MDINELADKARNDISDYCMNECKALCCRKGRLVVSREELSEIFHGDEKEIEESSKSIYNGKEDKFMLDLHREGKGCPALRDEVLCSIHKSSKRPQTCGDFPIFFKGKNIHIHQRCPAAFEGKFYAFSYEATLMGYKIFDRK